MSTQVLSTWTKNLPQEVADLIAESPKVIFPESRQELVELSLGGTGADTFDVAYDIPDQGRTVVANVIRCRNGIAVNYLDPYMRRRDPDCMVVADEGPTDKIRFQQRFGNSFDSLRGEILAWLATQELVVLPFKAGSAEIGYDAMMVAPANAAFFATSLADLQGMIPQNKVSDDFSPLAVIYVAPPFQQTHCNNQQVVVHNRKNGLHELFSLNLYPGPSAKKGVYGVLLSIGEKEGWITAHGSTVQVVTPYDIVLTIMHEGASGGGKSEMLEYVHREHDGRLLLGENVVTKEKRFLVLNQACQLHPVTDDMALCHPALQQDKKKLVVTDAEQGWFLRVNHITKYGTDPHLESLCTHPSEPILFLNIHGVPNATCLIWEAIEDKPGVKCPNPRVIMPRRMVPHIVNEPVEVDVRSFGVRTPPCTPEYPSYGIMGLLHVLPPALGYLWRLVAPRGYGNPSIIDTEGMASEGVGSYWPFATGRKVDQANLLLNQVRSTLGTRYTLSPNQHVGAWKVGFMPQWIAREYLARRGGAKFRKEQLVPARCPLLGNALFSMMVEGATIPRWFLQVDTQPEVGEEVYDKGAKLLTDFFVRELKPYLEESELDPLGRRIIECCIDGGQLKDYEALLPQS